MEKSERKAAEKNIGNVLLEELKKLDPDAASNIKKHVKETVRTLTKKFAKEIKSLKKLKAEIASTGIAKKIVKPAVRKAIVKTATAIAKSGAGKKLSGKIIKSATTRRPSTSTATKKPASAVKAKTRSGNLKAGKKAK